MDVAQLVEPRVVIPVVVGSSPIVHPNLQTEELAKLAGGKRLRRLRRSKDGPLAQLVEQETLNLLVVGSIPTRPTNQLNDLQRLSTQPAPHFLPALFPPGK